MYHSAAKGPSLAVQLPIMFFSSTYSSTLNVEAPHSSESRTLLPVCSVTVQQTAQLLQSLT